jgi:hypothetical protein
LSLEAKNAKREDDKPEGKKPWKGTIILRKCAVKVTARIGSFVEN